MEWAERYIGGKGLLLRYMWEYVPPEVDPWSPDNPVFLVTGPFAGTNVSTASRLVVGAKSPATGILDDSYVGGSFAPEMKFAGYDLIIITGKAPEPVVLWIKDDTVEFVPAEEKYWGLKTSEIEAALRADLDKDAKVLSIGPAGENLIPWACLSTDQFHKAGRGGHGALFGSKNLKAVAIRGTGSVQVGDARAFLADMRAHPQGARAHRLQPVGQRGGHAHPGRSGERRRGPSHPQLVGRAASTASAGINSEAMLRRSRWPTGPATSAPSAAARCTRPAGSRARGRSTRPSPSAAPTAGWATSRPCMRFNHECDEWGLDTISSGSVVGLAMDLTEKGIADFGLRFGEAEGYLAAPALIATAEGYRRRAGSGRAGPGRQVRGPRAGAWRSRTSSSPATIRAAPSA